MPSRPLPRLVRIGSARSATRACLCGPAHELTPLYYYEPGDPPRDR